MLTCKDIAALATEYAEGGLEAPARLEVETHLDGCQPCRTWLGQLAVTAGAVSRLPPAELPAALAEALLRRVDERAAHRAPRPEPVPVGGAGRRALWALPALVAAAALVAGLARSTSRDPADWLTAAGLLLAAVALAALARRLTWRVAALAISAALVAALLRGGAGASDLGDGLDCLLTEGALAAGAAGLAWLVARRGPGVLTRSGLGTWLVAGSLLGAAALQVACSHHELLPHLLLFHVGGVAAAALVGRWWSGSPSLQPA